MKKLVSAAAAMVFLMGSAYAADLASLKASPTLDPDGTVQLNNTVCPISGEEVTKDGGSLKLDGVVYKFCCAMCGGKLEKNPEKYGISADAKKGILDSQKANA